MAVGSSQIWGFIVISRRFFFGSFQILHDSAEIWGFMYELTLGIGTLKVMASPGVFVRVVCALKRTISSASHPPSTILT
jgi:hypothetical protein